MGDNEVPNNTSFADGESGATERPQITAAMEDYLKAVYRLAQSGPVTTQRIAEELRISGPSVTNMVKRLHELKMLTHARYHGVELTEPGKRVALEVIRHHRLLELYLAETLGYSWDEVHVEAERLEHHVSDELEARMDSALGYPTIDPHGDPIPTRDGQIASISEQTLLDLELHQPGSVVRVPDRDPEQLRYMGELGLYPSATVTVLERMPFEGPVRIQVGEREQLIGHRLASQVNVMPKRLSLGSSLR